MHTGVCKENSAHPSRKCWSLLSLVFACGRFVGKLNFGRSRRRGIRVCAWWLTGPCRRLIKYIPRVRPEGSDPGGIKSRWGQGAHQGGSTWECCRCGHGVSLGGSGWLWVALAPTLQGEHSLAFTVITL